MRTMLPLAKRRLVPEARENRVVVKEDWSAAPVVETRRER
jgi:hypothetical protein